MRRARALALMRGTYAHYAQTVAALRFLQQRKRSLMRHLVMFDRACAISTIYAPRQTSRHPSNRCPAPRYVEQQKRYTRIARYTHMPYFYPWRADATSLPMAPRHPVISPSFLRFWRRPHTRCPPSREQPTAVYAETFFLLSATSARKDDLPLYHAITIRHHTSYSPPYCASA